MTHSEALRAIKEFGQGKQIDVGEVEKYLFSLANRGILNKSLIDKLQEKIDEVDDAWIKATERRTYAHTQ